MQYFIEVILPLSLPKTFTYSVSEAEYNYIQIGMRVAVPFGKSKIYTALVTHLHQNAPVLYEAKEIHEILDLKPIVNEFQINHWQWISNYYMCAIGDVYRGALPSALLLESETSIALKTETFVDGLNEQKAWQWPSSFDKKGEILFLNSMRRMDTKGMDDIYISFQQNEVWSQPINIGNPINTVAYEDGAILSPDEKWLIFCRHESSTTPSRVLCIQWKPLLGRLRK